ncbi:pilus assembly protein PilM [Fusibacter paucivorans]|uniref:Pilus assembly protein PilM n=1 Tax=Fusibacter paucivorans TaxID=76009 RepID=A0ABS5PNC3_9FIRM|nr:cell division FtsA domain-containing protein [Fusibacter paucivorans]MBS7526407.1 pilus assembly protein PilM [Fusibacter paucivorans]
MSDKKLMPIPKDLLFALDIGTRNVVGTVARLNGKQYEVMDYEVMPHPDRAMFDGQIHDIEKVTEVVGSVVESLEQRNGFKLEKAAIAAAGRALKTEKATVERDVDFTKEITKNLTDTLEMEAVQAAQKQLMTAENLHAEYYCVGYSVIHYFLDQSMILNPIGHKGSKLKVAIIATFLPHIVVDSLYSVLQRAGLEVLNLTLEPIAAMNVTIPQKLRLLNLALVDVGAGTSDIAISRDGTVETYGMVAIAGDEITERLAQHYLLDFSGAELLKINLNKQDHHSFTDIMGMNHEISTAEVMTVIEPLVEDIAGHVAANIVQLNKKAPSAVFCIGGGSQIPGFTYAMAEALGLPKERVAIKSVEQLEQVTFMKEPLIGPEFITPIGIGVTAFSEREQDFIQVSVNDNILRLFHSKTLRVSDALIIAGISARSLLAERGDNMEMTLNGKAKTLRGEFGEPAKIFVNGMVSSLDAKISHKDQITIEPAQKGGLSNKTLGDLINYNAQIYFRGQTIKLVDFVNVNGVNRIESYEIQPGDDVAVKGIPDIKTLGLLMELDLREVVFSINGERVTPHANLHHGDQVDYEIMPSGYVEEEADPMIIDETATSETPLSIEDTETFKRIHEDRTVVRPLEAKQEGAAADGKMFPTEAAPYERSLDEGAMMTANDVDNELNNTSGLKVIVNGDDIQIENPANPMVFVDIFNHIDFDISEAKGILVLKLNGERARYTDILKNGDVIDISWKK